MAKAILDRGGKVIETESNKIIAKRKSLKDGEAVTTNSGYLPCKKVVHAVGPDFRDVGLPQSRILLRRVCLNSLIIAQELKMTSIALPAIGSGSCSMPKDECAKVMFDAVEEFVKQGNPKKKTITDIRFVNIDDPSVQAFRTEFISRYGYNHNRSSCKKVAGGRSMKASMQISDNCRSTKHLCDIVGSHNDSSFGRTNASASHPLSGPNSRSLPPSFYSGAVKISTKISTDARSFTAQEPGATGKTGFHFPLGSSTGRENEGKGNNIKYTNPVSFVTISSDNMCVSRRFSSQKKEIKVIMTKKVLILALTLCV